MKKIILLFCISCCFFSCESNNIEVENTLEGKWNVTQLTGGFSQPINYNIGDITWTFDLKKETVTILNKVDFFVDINRPPDFTNNQSGVYPFKIVTENNTNFLIVGNRKGGIELNKNGLTIDYGVAVDDIGYIFKR